jgi:hypothetical protein
VSPDDRRQIAYILRNAQADLELLLSGETLVTNRYGIRPRIA